MKRKEAHEPHKITERDKNFAISCLLNSLNEKNKSRYREFILQDKELAYCLALEAADEGMIDLPLKFYDLDNITLADGLTEGLAI